MLDKLKSYRFPLLLILVGALFIASVWTLKIKWIAFPVFLVGAVLIILGLTIAGNIAEADTVAKYEDYNKPVKYSGLLERVLHYAGYAVGFSVFFFFEIHRRLENIIGEGKFVLMATLAGLVAAIVVYMVFKRTYPGFFKNNKERQTSIFILCIGIIGWSILGMAMYNEWEAPTRVEKLSVLEKGKNVRNGTRYLFLKIGDEKHRFSPKRQEWDSIHEQDSIYATIATGNLNFEVITEFKPVDEFRSTPQTAH